MAAARKLLRSHEWAEVREGLLLLQHLNDPQLWALMMEGVSFAGGNTLYLEAGEIKKRVKEVNRYTAALFAARETGALAGRESIQFRRDIVDLRPLEGLTQLTAASLNCAPALRDLSPIASLRGLTKLTLRCSPPTDLSVLAGLPQLTELNLYTSHLKDLRPLQGMSNLTTLLVAGERRNPVLLLRDLSPLAGLTQLSSIPLNYCPSVHDLSPLKTLPQLEKLQLGWCDGVSRAEEQSLKAALPGCAITHW